MKTSKVLSIIIAIAIGLVIALFIKQNNAPKPQTLNPNSQQSQVKKDTNLEKVNKTQKGSKPVEISAETTETDTSKNLLTSEKLTYMITLKTNMGDIELTLNAEKAPNTVENFIQYAKKGQYDGTIFHRVIKGFMIQGGGFEPGMEQKSVGASILNEANNGLTNNKYTVAMARTGDPHSATAQFFINAKDNDFLNFTSESGSGWGYAVFGEVTKGKEIVDAIEMVTTGNSQGFGDVPLEDVIIESVIVAE